MHFRADGFKRLIRLTNKFRLGWVEIDLNEPSLMKALRAQSSNPIGSGELKRDLLGFRDLLSSEATDICIVDVKWIGIRQAKKVADLAETYDINICPHNHGSPLSAIMTAHYCASISNFYMMELDFDDIPEWGEFLTEPVKIENGHLILPSSNGWGVTLNMDVVEKYKK